MKQQIINNEKPARKNNLSLHQLSAACVAKLNQLKETVAEKLTTEFGKHLDPYRIKQAVNDADALVSITPFPALFLPELAEEKVRAVVKWEQERPARRQNSMLALAA